MALGGSASIAETVRSATAPLAATMRAIAHSEAATEAMKPLAESASRLASSLVPNGLRQRLADVAREAYDALQRRAMDKALEAKARAAAWLGHFIRLPHAQQGRQEIIRAAADPIRRHCAGSSPPRIRTSQDVAALVNAPRPGPTAGVMPAAA